MNINAENNPFIHVCTLHQLPYIDFHFPRKDFERFYLKIDLGRFWGITIGIWDTQHHVRKWKKIIFCTKSWRFENDLFS